MPKGNLGTMMIGPPVSQLAQFGGAGGLQDFGMNAVNNCVAWRFVARNTKIPAGVRLRFRTVTSGCTFTVRIETPDSSSPSKPSGTLYDPNAVSTGNVASNSGNLSGMLITFPTAPTTPLVVGARYFVVVIVTAAGTGCNLSYAETNNLPMARLPYASLTASDGSVRTNLTEVPNAMPHFALRYTDGTEDQTELGAYGFGGNTATTGGATVNQAIYGNIVYGNEFTVPYGVAWRVVGAVGAFGRNGTPADDLRVRILDMANTPVPGATSTYTVADSTNLSGRLHWSQFQEDTWLFPGTYRLVADSPGSVNSSNCFTVLTVGFFTEELTPAQFRQVSTTDISASPPVWTKETRFICNMALVVDEILPLVVPRTRSIKTVGV
jgi:hypothetical protein